MLMSLHQTPYQKRQHSVMFTVVIMSNFNIHNGSMQVGVRMDMDGKDLISMDCKRPYKWHSKFFEMKYEFAYEFEMCIQDQLLIVFAIMVLRDYY